MPNTAYLLFGICLLVMSVGFFAGYTPLLRRNLRSRSGVKLYMRRAGAVYALLGAVSLAFYFWEDAIAASRPLAILAGVLVIGALVALIIFNHSFMNRGGR